MYCRTGDLDWVEIFLFTTFSLTLPDKLKATDIKWLSVSSRGFQIIFADLLFPEGLSLKNKTLDSAVLSGLSDDYDYYEQEDDEDGNKGCRVFNEGIYN